MISDKFFEASLSKECSLQVLKTYRDRILSELCDAYQGHKSVNDYRSFFEQLYIINNEIQSLEWEIERDNAPTEYDDDES